MLNRVLPGLVLLLLSVSAWASPEALLGTWRSEDVSGGAVAGSLIFEKTGRITLAPDGFDPLTGTWELDDPFIRVTIPNRGVALMNYTLTNKGKRLDVRYENGTFQFFTKQAIAQKKVATP